MDAPSVHEPPTDGPSVVAPASALQRLRRYVNRGGPGQRRLELGLVVVLSGLLLSVANGLWHPKPRETVINDPHLATATTTAPASCDDDDESRFGRWLEDLEERGAARQSREELEVYTACARKQADAYPMSSLRSAADAGRLRAVRWLLLAAPVGKRNLDLALLEADAHPEVAALLRSMGAEPPNLVEAATRVSPHAVRAALESKAHAPADLSRALTVFVDRDASCTACDEAAYVREQARVVGLFFAKGATIDGEGLASLCARSDVMRDAHLGTALAHRQPGAIEAALGSMQQKVPVDVVRRVAAEGVDWGYRDGEDDAPMPLVRAVASQNEGVVRVLIELGAPVDRVYKDGSSALQSAVTCSEGQPACARITELLLAQGADPNRRFPDGTTPLFAAAEAGNGRVLRALIDEGARLETRVWRETPLNAAERVGNIGAARILAARGARIP
jgi:hypothetical protein